MKACISQHSQNALSPKQTRDQLKAKLAQLLLERTNFFTHRQSTYLQLMHGLADPVYLVSPEEQKQLANLDAQISHITTKILSQ